MREHGIVRRRLALRSGTRIRAIGLVDRRAPGRLCPASLRIKINTAAEMSAAFIAKQRVQPSKVVVQLGLLGNRTLWQQALDLSDCVARGGR